MATKPNETYKWGENATHEQVAAYEDTGWPADNIPPKRTQFNWYQNLVGRWLGWVEDAVDEIVETVLDAWFVEIPDNSALLPNKSGIYHIEGIVLVFVVENKLALYIQPMGPDGISIRRRFWTGSEWGASSSFTRSNTRSDILQESEANYVTPKGLVDYFSVPNNTPSIIDYVPNKTGIYSVAASSALSGGLAIVIEGKMWFISTSADANLDKNRYFQWENGIWVEKNSQ